MAECRVSKIRKSSDRSAVSEIILYFFKKTNIEGELISETGNEFQILGPRPFNHMNKSYWASPREVFTLADMQSKIKMQTIQYRKSRI